MPKLVIINLVSAPDLDEGLKFYISRLLQGGESKGLATITRRPFPVCGSQKAVRKRAPNAIVSIKNGFDGSSYREVIQSILSVAKSRIQALASDIIRVQRVNFHYSRLNFISEYARSVTKGEAKRSNNRFASKSQRLFDSLLFNFYYNWHKIKSSQTELNRIRTKYYLVNLLKFTVYVGATFLIIVSAPALLLLMLAKVVISAVLNVIFYIQQDRKISAVLKSSNISSDDTVVFVLGGRPSIKKFIGPISRLSRKWSAKYRLVSINAECNVSRLIDIFPAARSYISLGICFEISTLEFQNDAKWPIHSRSELLPLPSLATPGKAHSAELKIAVIGELGSGQELVEAWDQFRLASGSNPSDRLIVARRYLELAQSASDQPYFLYGLPANEIEYLDPFAEPDANKLVQSSDVALITGHKPDLYDALAIADFLAAGLPFVLTHDSELANFFRPLTQKWLGLLEHAFVKASRLPMRPLPRTHIKGIKIVGDLRACDTLLLIFDGVAKSSALSIEIAIIFRDVLGAVIGSLNEVALSEAGSVNIGISLPSGTDKIEVSMRRRNSSIFEVKATIGCLREGYALGFGCRTVAYDGNSIASALSEIRNRRNTYNTHANILKQCLHFSDHPAEVVACVMVGRREYKKSSFQLACDYMDKIAAETCSLNDEVKLAVGWEYFE